MLFARTVSALALACVFVAGCSSDERNIPAAVVGPPAPAPVGGSVTPDAGAADASTDIDGGDGGGGGCLANAAFAQDSAYGGTLAIRGRITFPAGLPAGRSVAVSIQAAVGGEVKQQGFATLAQSESYTYRIGGLIPGRYILRVQADATNNGSVADVGDFDGYYNGTASGPILLRADAVAVEVKDQCLDNIDFGAGIKP